jgi:hypothetical protein
MDSAHLKKLNLFPAKGLVLLIFFSSIHSSLAWAWSHTKNGYTNHSLSNTTAIDTSNANLMDAFNTAKQKFEQDKAAGADLETLRIDRNAMITIKQQMTHWPNGGKNKKNRNQPSNSTNSPNSTVSNTPPPASQSNTPASSTNNSTQHYTLPQTTTSGQSSNSQSAMSASTVVSLGVANTVPAPTPCIQNVNGTFSFSGYEWNVEDSNGAIEGPGKNIFDAQNVCLDSNGYLHLKITRAGNSWHAAQLQSTQSFGLGKYQFEIWGRPDLLDQNLCLGLFNYLDDKHDGQYETDIEFSTWGNGGKSNLNYTLYPNIIDSQKHELNPIYFPITGNISTHRFTWKKNELLYEAMNGAVPINTSANTNNGDLSTPILANNTITPMPLPIMMNLWIVEGKNAPANTSSDTIEMVITKFTYQPE